MLWFHKDLCNFSQANNKKEKPLENMTIGISKTMVGIDGSEESVNAADYAIAIAKRYNAELSMYSLLI